MSKQEVIFQDLGSMGYKEAWDLQERLLQENVRVKSEAVSRKSAVIGHPSSVTSEPSTTNHLLFVEHPPVYTLGKSGHHENILISEKDMHTKQIEFYKTNRGGDITFHGPGQVVGYPILDLEKFYTDIGRYMRGLEEVIILMLGEYGIESGRSAGETGVWLDAGISGRERKICAMGVRCSRWVTMHGFALNVNTDLSYFDFIIPCGIQNKKVTSLEKELGKKISMIEAKGKIKKNFEKVFDCELNDIVNRQWTVI
jgi:lipoyl(octanoyl) transferase